MPRFFSCLVLIFSCVAMLCGQAEEEKKIVKRVPVRETRPDNGAEMFRAYCAACHGPDGKGNGPAAAAMQKPPADLTQLTRINGGVFPAAHLYQVIAEDAVLSAHGSRDMPMWGSIFRQVDQHDQSLVKMRTRNLTTFIKSLQAR